MTLSRFQFFSLLTLLLCFLCAELRFQNIQQNDPDAYFYVYLARQTAEEGLVRRLEQASATKWAEQFSDKNFLFTQANALFYRIGGETGIRLGFATLSFLTILLLFSLLEISGSRDLWKLGLLLTAAFLVPDFTNRLVLFRPHAFAFPGILLLLLGARKRKASFLFWGGFYFVLCHQAFYLPLGILGALLLFRVLDARLCGMGMAGVVLGLVCNPYFPGNMEMGFLSLRIATNAHQIDPADRAWELAGLSAKQLFSRYGFWLLGAGFALYFSIRARHRLGTALATCAVGCWSALFLTQRILEYALVFSLLAMASIPLTRAARIFWSVGLLYCAFLALPFWMDESPGYQFGERILEASAHLPDGPTGVYNCEWASSPFVLYRKPEARFLDISDPYLMLEWRKDQYFERNRFRRGETEKPEVLLTDLKMNYVLCFSRPAISRMESNPHFRRLFPDSYDARTLGDPNTPFLYALSFNQ